MGIPESQLMTWSHQGAIITSKLTYASIKSKLEAGDTPYTNRSFQVFLQGSYGNDTNIRSDSDVDIVIMLTSICRPDFSMLPQTQISAYHKNFSPTSFQFSDFKNSVITKLQRSYGYQNIQVSDKSVKVAASSNRLGADIVVCYQYRFYYYFYSEGNQLYDEGIFFSTGTGGEIINFPKLHSQNCTIKHQNTGNRFKPTVRIFKNMRSRLIDDGYIPNELAPSYYIEGLLYNVPDDKFKGSYGQIFCNCIDWLRHVDRLNFMCPNKKFMLFGSSSVQWDNDKCNRFLKALVDLWNRR